MSNNRVLRSGESEGNVGSDWSYVPPAGGITNSIADVPIKAAVAARRNYLVSLQLSVGVVLANASEIVVKDGSTIIHRQSLPVTAGVQPPITFNPPLRSSVNAALNIAAVTVFATGNVAINAQGYTV
jgi:hypothetical protein